MRSRRRIVEAGSNRIKPRLDYWRTVMKTSMPHLVRMSDRQIGAERIAYPGKLRTIRQHENDAGGCSGGFRLDSFVDVYPRLRLGYIFTFEGDTYLDTIATTRPGDRTSLGFTIMKSTFKQVRVRYPTARTSRHLGGRTLTVSHRTGYESGAHLVYGFDASSRLVRLETGVGGC